MSESWYTVEIRSDEFPIKEYQDWSAIKPGCSLNCEEPDVRYTGSSLEEAKACLNRFDPSIQILEDHGQKYVRVEEAFLDLVEVAEYGSVYTDTLEQRTLDYAKQMHDKLMEDVEELKNDAGKDWFEDNAQSLLNYADEVQNRMKHMDTSFEYLKDVDDAVEYLERVCDADYSSGNAMER